MKASIKNIKLPDAPPPTRAVYKKPVIYNNPKHMRVVELPCEYNPRPAPMPAKKPQPKKKPKARGIVDREGRHYSQQRQTWPEDRINKLIERYNEGIPVEDISKELGCSRSVAYVLIGRLRDSGRIQMKRCVGWSKEQDQKAIEMYNAGVPYTDIAEKMGKSLSAVSNRLQRLRDVGEIGERERITKRK